jgi:UDP-N-acetylglucosamine 4,6-dehydratase
MRMRVLVTGGTGSFGHAFVKRHHQRVDIRVLSRDEEKQRAMSIEYPDVEFMLGDVRDLHDVEDAMHGVDRVFHAAALKQVVPLEAAPMQAIRTNIIGTDNVCRAADGRPVVTLSTDKAVEPVGVMGASKMLAESVTTSWGYNVVRYGNILGSRGSIIRVWREAMAKGEPVTITDPDMTRFVITLDDALDLVDLAMRRPPDGSVYVRRSPAATVAQFARVVAGDHPLEVIGIRPGEKRHEHLVVPDEHVIEEGDHFRVVPGEPGTGHRYSSEHARHLTDDELAALIEVA